MGTDRVLILRFVGLLLVLGGLCLPGLPGMSWVDVALADGSANDAIEVKLVSGNTTNKIVATAEELKKAEEDVSSKEKAYYEALKKYADELGKETPDGMTDEERAARISDLEKDFKAKEALWTAAKKVVADLQAEQKNLEEKLKDTTVQVSLKYVNDTVQMDQSGVVPAQPETDDPLLEYAYEALNQKRRPADEEDGFNFKDFINERIDLHYYTNVQALMQCLNPGSYNIDPRLDKLQQITDAKKNREELELKVKASRTTTTEALRMYQSLAKTKDSQRGTLVYELEQAKIARSRLKVGRDDTESITAADTRVSTATTALKNYDDGLANPTGTGDEDSGAKAIGLKLKAAGDVLKKNIATLQELEAKLLTAVELESQSYAFSYANAPFWVAVPRVSQNDDVPGTEDDKWGRADPINRVFLFAFPGANYLIARGQPGDVLHVRDLISKFDDDATQARLTLWAIELNSDASQKGAERMNEAFAIVDNEFSLTRQQIALATSLFVDVVVRQVHDANKEGSEVSKRLGERQGFFSKELRDRWLSDSVDPANITTVGEALLIASLGRPKHRQSILDEFERLMGTLICQYSLESPGVDKLCFNRLRRVLSAEAALYSESKWNGASIGNTKINDPLDGKQVLIARAIKGKTGDIYIQGLVNELVLRIVAEELHLLSDEDDEKAKVVRCDELVKGLFEEIHRVEQSVGTSVFSLRVRDELEHATALEIVDDYGELFTPSDDSIEKQLAAESLSGLKALDSTTVAKANELLKSFNIAFEDDLDEIFVQPMLVRLRKRIISAKVGFGVVQRTSILATDRETAAIDPRTIANLDYGFSTNYLDELQSAVDLGQGMIGNNLAGSLGLLQGQLPFDNGNVTNVDLGGGSRFEVTPIFDRTGQAVRYRLNHVYSNSIRNYDGTTTPHFERTSIHSTVQTSNFEIREIGRYETTYSIGKPEKKTGGLPLIRHDPVIRDLPLLGYYNISGGQNAVLQENILFAQSVIYSSINDMRELFLTAT